MGNKPTLAGRKMRDLATDAKMQGRTLFDALNDYTNSGTGSQAIESIFALVRTTLKNITNYERLDLIDVLGDIGDIAYEAQQANTDEKRKIVMKKIRDLEQVIDEMDGIISDNLRSSMARKKQ